MENKLAIFTQEIINIKEKYGTQYFTTAGFHSVLKDVYPSIENKYLMVFKAADHFQLYEKIYQITTFDESKKIISSDNLKQQFIEDSGLDVSIAAVVFWAYLYGNGLTKDKFSLILKSSQESATISNKENTEVFAKEEAKQSDESNVRAASAVTSKKVGIHKNRNVVNSFSDKPITRVKSIGEKIKEIANFNDGIYFLEDKSLLASIPHKIEVAAFSGWGGLAESLGIRNAKRKIIKQAKLNRCNTVLIESISDPWGGVKIEGKAFHIKY